MAFVLWMLLAAVTLFTLSSARLLVRQKTESRPRGLTLSAMFSFGFLRAPPLLLTDRSQSELDRRD